MHGLTAEQRAAANPYIGRKVPLGGMPSGVARGAGGVGRTDVDAGLRQFMLDVYGFMFAGMMLTGIVAFLTYAATVTTDPSLAYIDELGPWQITETEYLNPLGVLLWGTPIAYVVCFGPLVVCLLCGSVFRGCNPALSGVLFALIATLIGVSFSGLALTYTNASMTSVFFCTAAAFGSLSLYGYTTGKDLSGWGSFLWMGLFGVIVAAIFNLFLQSDALQFAVSSIGVIVFAGFTAYDTQMIKEAYSDRLDERTASALAINGALDLYLDFVNLFRFLLYFFGEQE